MLGLSKSIAAAYINNGLADDMLLAAMSDPTIKVPALDKEIPRMQLEGSSSTELKVNH
jgi:hypothetical protein